jgi:hypothetical protein
MDWFNSHRTELGAAVQHVDRKHPGFPRILYDAINRAEFVSSAEWMVLLASEPAWIRFVPERLRDEIETSLVPPPYSAIEDPPAYI